MKTRKILSLALALMMVLTLLAACSPAEEDPVDPGVSPPPGGASADPSTDPGTDSPFDPPPDGIVDTNIPFAVVNDNPAIEGGVLRVGYAAPGPFRGLLSPLLYQGNDDAQLLNWFDEGLLSYDLDFVADQDGPATYTSDSEAKTITLTLRPGITWHDGAPLTLDDLVFAYEVIIHPDYTGPRFNDEFRNIVGWDAYRDGESDTISGLVLSEDNMQLTIHFHEFVPTLLVNGFWSSAAPRHYLGDIPVADLETHDRIRINPIGFGPFKLESIVPGESAIFTRFDDYWKGAPKLEGIDFKVIAPEMVPAAMENGEFDVADFSTQHYLDYLNPTNFQYIAQLATVFNYFAFDLGYWDDENETVVLHDNPKLGNLNLRKALAHAVDHDTLNETVWNGLRVRATTMITPRHGGYQNQDIPGFYYDPDKAKQLLDEAGYIDVDGDGFREDPDGEQLTITFAHMEGAGAETITQFMLQCWADVGLRVELFLGRLHDFNVFYDYVEYNEPGLDMWAAAWQTGINPDPAGLWGNHAWNYSKYIDDELVEAMAACIAEEAWDDTFRINAFRHWQQLMYDKATAIPFQWRMELMSVNNRVKNYDMMPAFIDAKLHLIELTADAPYVK
ncbi:MAG: ABC transporter substrate-binding protein [Oscillospiraceae bacterium]|nr:ABC transporter substrate-binding protein [Oscillospiraceae bacterium]